MKRIVFRVAVMSEIPDRTLGVRPFTPSAHEHRVRHGIGGDEHPQIMGSVPSTRARGTARMNEKRNASPVL